MRPARVQKNAPSQDALDVKSGALDGKSDALDAKSDALDQQTATGGETRNRCAAAGGVHERTLSYLACVRCRRVCRCLGRAAGQTYRLVLDENFFIENVLPWNIVRQLSDTEMNAYRKPFLKREARRPTLVWPRELPIEGEPADVVEIVERYSAWLARSTIPKLFINAGPGALLTGRARDFCRLWPNQREVTVKGIHYVQEDSPAEIGAALRAFLLTLGAG